MAFFRGLGQDQKKAENLYLKYWSPVFEKDDEIKEFWDEEVLTGREKKSRSDIFLHNFAIIEQIINPSSETLSKMTELYKGYIEKKNEADLLLFIEKFTQYAKVFQSLPFFHIEEEYLYSDTMKRFLQIIQSLQLSTFTPIALFLELLYTEKKIAESDYINSLLLLEKYMIRRTLCNLDSSGYNKTIYNLINNLSNSKYNNIYNAIEDFISNLKADTDRYPSEKEIKDLPFTNFDTKLAKLLLFWIELKRRKDEKEYSDAKEAIQFNFQLEHLMPRAWGEYWKLPDLEKTLNELNEELPEDQDIYDMSDYEFIEKLNNLDYNGEEILKSVSFRSSKVDELGNFTILTGKLNNSLRNYEWQRKLNGDGTKKGIKYYSSLILNRELCDNYTNSWNEETISERTKKLKEYITKIWGK